jgi:hypothetical protein
MGADGFSSIAMILLWCHEKGYGLLTVSYFNLKNLVLKISVIEPRPR